MTRLAMCVLLALVGCGQRSTELDAVRRLMRDPDSVRFGEHWTSGEYRCGYVNAKNGYGGYVGYKPYLVAGSYAEVFDAQTERWESRCKPAELRASMIASTASVLATKPSEIQNATVVDAGRGMALCATNTQMGDLVYNRDKGVVLQRVEPSEYKFWAQWCPPK